MDLLKYMPSGRPWPWIAAFRFVRNMWNRFLTFAFNKRKREIAVLQIQRDRMKSVEYAVRRPVSAQRRRRTRHETQAFTTDFTHLTHKINKLAGTLPVNQGVGFYEVERKFINRVPQYAETKNQ